jgi:hypothetical protein
MPITPTFVPIHSFVATTDVFNITFSSIDQTYDHLVLTGGFTRGLSGDFGGRSAQFQWNGITSGYKAQSFASSNGNTAYASRATNAVSGPDAPAGNLNDQGGRQAWEAWIPNYRSTKYQKHILFKSWNNDTQANNGGAMNVFDYLVPTTSALSSLYIFESVDPMVAGDWITIYGVKNA